MTWNTIKYTQDDYQNSADLDSGAARTFILPRNEEASGTTQEVHGPARRLHGEKRYNCMFICSVTGLKKKNKKKGGGGGVAFTFKKNPMYIPSTTRTRKFTKDRSIRSVTLHKGTS